MTAATAPAPPATAVRAGLRDVVPVIVGLAPFGLTIGATVVSTAFDDLAGWLAGPVVIAGAAHLALVTAVDAGTGALLAVLTAVVINVRLAAYSAAIAPHFAAQPRWFRWAAPYALVDQMFALAMSRPEAARPEWLRRYWMAVAVPLCLAWYGLISTGMALGPVIPARWELWFFVPLMFVAITAPAVRDRRALRSALVAALVAAVTAGLPGGLGVGLAIVAGCAAGAAGRGDHG